MLLLKILKISPSLCWHCFAIILSLAPRRRPISWRERTNCYCHLNLSMDEVPTIRNPLEWALFIACRWVTIEASPVGTVTGPLSANRPLTGWLPTWAPLEWHPLFPIALVESLCRRANSIYCPALARKLFHLVHRVFSKLLICICIYFLDCSDLSCPSELFIFSLPSTNLHFINFFLYLKLNCLVFSLTLSLSPSFSPFLIK